MGAIKKAHLLRKKILRKNMSLSGFMPYYLRSHLSVFSRELWVELARTMSIKLRWRNRVDLNRDHRLSRDTEMPTSDISFQKNNDAVARLAVYIG